VRALPDQGHAWLVVAMASTLAGNLTLVGSVANLIVAERARARGSNYRYGAYCRAGIPMTLTTLAIGAWWLS
jgi:Na+/H+ antiporter NhaD/arsenite permease-like protein